MPRHAWIVQKRCVCDVLRRSPTFNTSITPPVWTRRMEAHRRNSGRGLTAELRLERMARVKTQIPQVISRRSHYRFLWRHENRYIGTPFCSTSCLARHALCPLYIGVTDGITSVFISSEMGGASLPPFQLMDMQHHLHAASDWLRASRQQQG